MTDKKVSIIVVSYKAGQMLRDCIASLELQEYRNTEIIIVDNGSGAGLSSEYARHKVITLAENLGFAGGNNAGIASASGQYIALINDDAVADPGWTARMLDVFGDIDDCGAVASAVIDGNKPGVIDSCGVGVALDGMSRQAFHGRPAGSLPAMHECLAFSGCGCMIRADVLRITGLFDDKFFAYCEDTDLSLRILRAGFRIIFTPKARITHYYSHTGGRYSLNKVFWVERNHFWVAVKNFPMPLIWLIPAVTLWRFSLQLWSLITPGSELRGFTGNGILAVMATILKAQFSALKAAPSMVRANRDIFKAHGISAYRFTNHIMRFKMDMKEIIY